MDELRGEYRGIAIGDSESKARSRFGRPSRGREGECDLCPAGTTVDDELGQPTVVDSPPGPPGSDRSLRYRRVVFMVSGGRVFGLLVTDRRAATRRGVGIGDPLERVSERYRALRCGIANEGSEYRTYPYCAGRLGRLFVSFGEDPIKSITVSSTRLDG